jgi:thermostable 8-oxoguanine DNA glycosylase
MRLPAAFVWQWNLWLALPQNIMRLQSIKGIKEKTAHYLQMLAGIQGIAIDRHLQRFLEGAGTPCRTYLEARLVLDETAQLIGVAPSNLDYSIWKYMSARQMQAQGASCIGR